MEGDIRTEVNDIENFGTPVFRDASKELTIGAGGGRNDGCEMSTIMLHKFNAGLLLLPELDMTIHGGCDQEVCPIPRCRSKTRYR